MGHTLPTSRTVGWGPHKRRPSRQREQSVSKMANFPGCAHAEWAAPFDHWQRILYSGFATSRCWTGRGAWYADLHADTVVAIACGGCGAGQPAVKRQVEAGHSRFAAGEVRQRLSTRSTRERAWTSYDATAGMPIRYLQVRHRPFRETRQPEGGLWASDNAGHV